MFDEQIRFSNNEAISSLQDQGAAHNSTKIEKTVPSGNLNLTTNDQTPLLL